MSTSRPTYLAHKIESLPGSAEPLPADAFNICRIAPAPPGKVTIYRVENVMVNGEKAQKFYAVDDRGRLGERTVLFSDIERAQRRSRLKTTLIYARLEPHGA